MFIKGFRQREWEGNAFLFSTRAPDSLRKIYGSKRIALLKIGLGLLTAILIFYLGNLQIISGADFKNLAEENRIRNKEIKPLRGIIYDRQQNPLVTNAPSFSLMATPIDLYQHRFPVDQIASRLRVLFPDISAAPLLEDKLNTISYIPIVIKKNLTYEEGVKLIPEIEEWPGVFLQESFKRQYLYGELLAPILGYTSFVSPEDLEQDDYYSLSDIKGAAGIELAFEQKLRGQKGQKRVQVNSLGKEDKIIDYRPSQKGTDIILTVDLKAQEKLAQILSARMIEFKVERAAAIALDPRDGSILALISLPSFDDNIFTSQFDENKYRELIQNPNKPLFNRAIAGEYPPGSTFKLIVAAGALEEGNVDKNTTVLSTGGIRIGEWFFPDWLAGGHGTTNVTRALAWSVNTYFYAVGGGAQNITGLGLEGLAKYANLFHLGQPTQIELPGEASGFFPSAAWKLNEKNEAWYLGDTYHLSIGQGDLLVTPLQMAQWTAFFANSGTLYQPHLLSGNVHVIDKNFISSKNIEIVRKGLRDTVTLGSARSLNSLPVTIAGKTGSAQFASNKKPHGWFTGYAPAEAPTIVLTVLMEEGDGSNSAVPVAREFLDWYFTQK